MVLFLQYVSINTSDFVPQFPFAVLMGILFCSVGIFHSKSLGTGFGGCLLSLRFVLGGQRVKRRKHWISHFWVPLLFRSLLHQLQRTRDSFGWVSIEICLCGDICDLVLNSFLSPPFLANFAVVAGAYAFAFLVDTEDDDESDAKQPAWLKFVYKSLDFGSGRERGARK